MSTLRSLGRYTEAKEKEREVLEKRRAILGSNHPQIIIALAKVALSLSSMGCHDEAEKMQKEVLEEGKVTFGPNHPYTL